MPLDSGLFVLVCSLFFVFLALLKQNVLVFVSQNMDGTRMNLEQRALFRAYDVDYNGVIDQDEFLLIATNMIPKTEVEVKKEPDLEETYMLLSVTFEGTPELPFIKKEVEFLTSTLSIFIPKILDLGYNWVIYEGFRTPLTSYYSTQIRPAFSHYPIYQLFSEIHWNVVLDTHYRPPITSAIVSALSDSHVRINFLVRVEYQLSVPLATPSWLVPCDPCPEGQCDKSQCEVMGEAVFSLEDMMLDYFSVRCGGATCTNPRNTVSINNVGSVYKYKIKQGQVVSVPLTRDTGVSYQWHKELREWIDVLQESTS